MLRGGGSATQHLSLTLWNPCKLIYRICSEKEALSGDRVTTASISAESWLMHPSKDPKQRLLCCGGWGVKTIGILTLDAIMQMESLDCLLQFSSKTTDYWSGQRGGVQMSCVRWDDRAVRRREGERAKEVSRGLCVGFGKHPGKERWSISQGRISHSPWEGVCVKWLSRFLKAGLGFCILMPATH